MAQRAGGPAPRSSARLVASSPDVPLAATREGQAGRILAAALGLFAQRGFFGTSIRDIAAAVGLQSASLYGHFPSKEHILAELVFAGHEEHHRRLTEAVAAASPCPVAELTAWVDAHVRMHLEFPVLTLVANTELHALRGDFAQPALDLRHRSEQLLTDIIKEGRRSGDFDPPHDWMAMAAIGGMGIRVASWYQPSARLKPDLVAKTYAEMALRIVGASPSSS